MARVTIQSMENGPNLVFLDGKVFSAMCRCGQSQQKPLCDGSHAKVGFRAPKAELKVLE
ncbi:MAG: CDGSH iron-sulfur domain-containing protein [Thermoplasmata archaeon]|nr:CDGSH iron-sulfur domain-containing protein [Thermoplasmata archaeon]